MAVIKQWVNLRRDDTDSSGATTNYVGTQDINTINEVEYRLYECSFAKANLALFKVRIKPIKGNKGNYLKKDGENTRNPHFKLKNLGSYMSRDKKTKFPARVDFPAAGGCQYKIEAQYKKKVVESQKIIETWRRIYYQVISMNGVPIAPLADFQNTFKKYYIDMKEEAPAEGKNKLTLRETLFDSDAGTGPANESTIIHEAKSCYQIGKFQPNAAAIIFVKNIATYKEMDITTPLKAIPSYWDALFGDSETVFDVQLKDMFGNDAYVWKDLATAKDIANYWLGNVSIVTETGKQLPLDKSAVTINDSVSYRQHGGRKYGFSKLKVIVKKSDVGNWFKTEKVFVKLTVRVVKGFSGGYSKSAQNVIFVATRAWWNPNDTPPAELLYIINHEMGHKIGMVACGNSATAGAGFYAWIDKKAPNAPPKIYGQYYNGPLANNKGHQGPHCEKGATYTAATNVWTGTPGCVMFGATSSSTATAPPAFCADCGKVVTKLDLQGQSLIGLKNRFF